jgi:2,3-bisphosphoglycerate-independent phosphoglycerate mutase
MNYLKQSFLVEMVKDLKKSKKAVHLLGLLSDGGVHSHQDHMAYLVKFFAENDVKIYLHAFLDGRDVAQKSATDLYQKFCADVGGEDRFELATVGGRYYGMDRDNKWDRIQLAYNAFAYGKSGYEREFSSFNELVKNCYDQNITDEFVKPCAMDGYGGVEEGDGLLFCNFRSDRARQISDALLDADFGGFERKKIDFSHKVAMTRYSDSLEKYYDILFPSLKIDKSLPEILSQNGLRQLRVAETEKFAHVTFFFSCGKENEFEGEKRILVPSPDVATYDLQPEMSANKVTDNLVRL